MTLSRSCTHHLNTQRCREGGTRAVSGSCALQQPWCHPHSLRHTCLPPGSRREQQQPVPASRSAPEHAEDPHPQGPQGVVVAALEGQTLHLHHSGTGHGQTQVGTGALATLQCGVCRTPGTCASLPASEPECMQLPSQPAPARGPGRPQATRRPGRWTGTAPPGRHPSAACRGASTRRGPAGCQSSVRCTGELNWSLHAARFTVHRSRHGARQQQLFTKPGRCPPAPHLGTRGEEGEEVGQGHLEVDHGHQLAVGLHRQVGGPGMPVQCRASQSAPL